MSTCIDLGMARGLLPERPKDSHKGAFGHVFIVAGSRGFTGAAKLTGESAARSGVGLVTVGIPEPLAHVVAAGLLECMTLPLAATGAETLSRAAVEQAVLFAESKDAVVLGPGISQHAKTREFVLDFVVKCPIPLLVDADGLNNLSGNTALLDRRTAPTVLTPHPGEMARLTQSTAADVQARREEIAAEFASAHKCVLVLKGYRTVVASETGEVYVNSTGNSGLATGGTGDVLSGLIGGLMAQGMAVLDAALLGVYVHGLAGDIAAKAKTERGMIARDVLDAIPDAWRILEQGT